MKKILITGSQGQLGRALNAYYADSAEVQLINTDVKELNITDEKDVMDKIKALSPDIIINCAAHTQVDACESEKEKAYLLNALGPKYLSLAANAVDAVLVHLSSDYVFDGKKKDPYTEEDEYNPQSVYGKTKMEGEEFVRDLAHRYFIVRTAWLYGEGKNFVNTMLKLSETKEEITVVKDQIGNPTSAEEVAKVIAMLIKTDLYGTYHATCEGNCSWAEFAQCIMVKCGKDTKIIPVTTEDYAAPAARPAYSMLDNKNLRERFHYNMKNWEEALDEYLKKRDLLVKESR